MSEQTRLLLLGAFAIAAVSGFLAWWLGEWLVLLAIGGWSVLYLIGAWFCWTIDREEAKQGRGART